MASNLFKLIGNKFSTSSATTNFENYVQVLIVLCNKSAPAPAPSKILLAKWKDGNYAGRYTGIIHKYDGIISKENLDAYACSLIPKPLAPAIPKLKLHGILQFDGPPECNEYIYIGSVVEAAAAENLQTVSYNPTFDLQWFDLQSIPYAQMPADDAIWYEQVLVKNKFITGKFYFGGIQEREIKSYNLKVMDNENELKV